MEVIFDSLLNTEWGLIIFGVFIFIGILIGFFNNKPKT